MTTLEYQAWWKGESDDASRVVGFYPTHAAASTWSTRCGPRAWVNGGLWRCGRNGGSGRRERSRFRVGEIPRKVVGPTEPQVDKTHPRWYGVCMVWRPGGARPSILVVGETMNDPEFLRLLCDSTLTTDEARREFYFPPLGTPFPTSSESAPAGRGGRLWAAPPRAACDPGRGVLTV